MAPIDNLRPPALGKKFPIYPTRRQLLRVSGNANVDGAYRCFVQQFVGPKPRDREAAYVFEPNGLSLKPGYYRGILVNAYGGAPLYAVSTRCCQPGGVPTSGSASQVPGSSSSKKSLASPSLASPSLPSASFTPPPISIASLSSSSSASSASASASSSLSGSLSSSSGGLVFTSCCPNGLPRTLMLLLSVVPHNCSLDGEAIALTFQGIQAIPGFPGGPFPAWSGVDTACAVQWWFLCNTTTNQLSFFATKTGGLVCIVNEQFKTTGCVSILYTATWTFIGSCCGDANCNNAAVSVEVFIP